MNHFQRSYSYCQCTSQSFPLQAARACQYGIYLRPLGLGLPIHGPSQVIRPYAIPHLLLESDVAGDMDTRLQARFAGTPTFNSTSSLS